MTPKEEASLREIYQQWPNERLARAATLEKGEYQPEAVVVMLEELKKRGIAEVELPKVVASVPPPIVEKRVERDTRMLPARLNRVQYLVRWLIWAVALIVGGELAVFVHEAAFILWIVAALIYRVIGLDIPRVKSAGMSPWLLLLLLVPLANIAMLVILLVAPPKK
jgi:hypothetical protein